MGNRSKEQQALYSRNPLRAASNSLTSVRNSFATQQRRLLNQLQQQMSSKESRRDEASRSSQDNNAAQPEQAPRTTLRTTLRDGSKKSAKINEAAQASKPRSVLRKENPNLRRSQEKSQQEDVIQEKQDAAGSPLTDSEDDLQLNAPPPKSSVTTVEGLSELLFSEDHLKYIVQDPLLYTRFAQFLAQYQPQTLPILLHHMEISKAAKALEYANAVAGSLGPFPGDSNSQGIQTAAVMNKDLEERKQRVVDILMSEALPAQINFGLIDVVTNAMQKAIRGTQQTPRIRNLIGGLTEVFTLTDPSIQDNPIIYASEEFYNMTGYGRDYVIGRNCRFLQGPKTSRHSVRRLKMSIDSGIEISETLLNYRRDGTPFMNLLLVAPLHDNKGDVKYYIGAQVDVTGLVEEGQGLDGFDEFLSLRRRQGLLKRHGVRGREEGNLALEKLAELSEMFDVTESAIIRSRSRANSLTRDSGYGSGNQPSKSTNRRIIIEEPPSDDDDVKSQVTESLENNSKWKLAPPGVATGILPGVYQKYLLLRPAPSLKVIFVSPGLRSLGKMSKRGFLECIESTKLAMAGLQEAFETGSPVSAKISWKYTDSSDTSVNGEKKEKTKAKRDTWISATPMLGSDDSIGVWMIVVVQNPPSTENSQNNPTTAPKLDTKQQEQQDAEVIDKKKTIDSDAESTPKGHQRNYSTPMAQSNQQRYQPQTPQPRPKSTSISSVFETPKTSMGKGDNSNSTKRYSVQSHSFSQSIPFLLSDSNASTSVVGDDEDDASTPQPRTGDASPGSMRGLPALQDSEGMEKRRNEGGKVGGPDEIRIRESSEDADTDGKDGEEDDDSGVDTVDEDEDRGRARDGGSETPKGKKGEAVETWSPPSKNIWVKPPRPSLPSRMMSVD